MFDVSDMTTEMFGPLNPGKVRLKIQGDTLNARLKRKKNIDTWTVLINNKSFSLRVERQLINS